jgi:hypothetical protein
MITDPIPDVIVLIPGILGSVLQKNGSDVWALSGSGIGRALATHWESIQALALHGDSDQDDLGDQVVASRLVADVHLIPWLWKIDGYSKIRRALTNSFADIKAGVNFFEFPYDWRRDNRVAARRFQRESSEWLEARRKTTGNDQAKLILICHSMGGLVARHFLEVLGGWKDTLALITFGTPYRGSVNALNFIANGMRKKLGPIPIVDLSNLLASFTSVYQLLPVYRCHDEGKGHGYLKDAKHIPNLDLTRVETAKAFHDKIEEAVNTNLKDPAYQANRYLVHPIVGTRQPTLQSSRFTTEGGFEILDSFDGKDQSGDGTVPSFSATPIEIEKEKRETFIAEAHGSLQNATAVWDHIESVLKYSRQDLSIFRGDLQENKLAVALAIDDLYERGEPICPKARPDGAALLTATVTDVDGKNTLTRQMDKPSDGWHEFEFPPLSEGVYRIRISGAGVAPVQDVFAVGG